MLLGRVGDTPLIGCGFYAGEYGGIVVTGIGEEIIKRMVSMRVYKLVEDGYTLEEACKIIMKSFPDNVPVGIIAITKYSYSIVSNTVMANYAIIK